MRALILARPKTPVPMEYVPMVAHGFKEWRQQHREQLETFSFFTGGNGGCAIANVDNETELFEMMMSWPLNPYSEIETHILVDGDEALTYWVNMIENQASAQQR